MTTFSFLGELLVELADFAFEPLDFSDLFVVKSLVRINHFLDLSLILVLKDFHERILV